VVHEFRWVRLVDALYRNPGLTVRVVAATEVLALEDRGRGE
jgi:hypothetical protein